LLPLRRVAEIPIERHDGFVSDCRIVERQRAVKIPVAGNAVCENPPRNPSSIANTSAIRIGVPFVSGPPTVFQDSILVEEIVSSPDVVIFRDR